MNLPTDQRERAEAVLTESARLVDAVHDAVRILNQTYLSGLHDGQGSPHSAEYNEAARVLICHLGWLKARAGVYVLAGEIAPDNESKRKVLKEVR